ncbi:MAG TPA: sugar ABC transporter permease [Spirochaetales bacterium]|nr:sugar ABC transporter permease [Spirochaetales bacterium]HRY56333.1 sugar ABC transporter permease [Spirochaetia bacterium]HRZ65582.1 sugar ABC transporter permease [Spirochaetia bacterium]
MSSRKLSWYRPGDPWLMLLPTVAGLALFRLGPMLGSLLLGFADWNMLTPPAFIGLGNYTELLADPVFPAVLRSTLEFSLLYVAGVMALGLAIALLLDRKARGIGFFRAAFYSPVITSAVAVGIVWSWLLSPRYGLLNNLLATLGLPEPYWLGDPRLALPTVAIVQVWKMSGYYMIIFLAGLQGIPHSLIEASKIDGASPRQRFFTIILPLLSPTTFFVLNVALIDSFKNFELIYAMTKGGPQNATNTLVYDVYLNGFVHYRTGYASALSYVLLACVALVTGLSFLAKKRWVKYQY